ncbi:hypothetical protein K491DRAFT_778686 [Lophiostoma macrostomum CBS 122681]|uniref:CENP-V/GFA domain-containing protein n=1 Tax=Lophiostoma macrostomum CBS 122681 TaxID=1314788 RepID=A0A6A6T870_9PLEO|nr:hypothetical protein K491DRAFT_778686 [Lophiostoma macrostomum CBS 122681]
MSNEPQYPESSDSETYEGTCHCGTVQYSVILSPPLLKQKVVSCNCSICIRHGYLFVYPSREQLTLKSGADAMNAYTFGQKRSLHRFCTKCGCSVYTDPRMTEYGGESLDLLAVNVRMFQNIELNDLNIVEFDGKKEMPFIGDDAPHRRESSGKCMREA